MGEQVIMIDERSVLEEMYTASVRRMDLQILRSKALSRLGYSCYKDSVGIWTERSFSGC
jgi:hypothetical protein